MWTLDRTLTEVRFEVRHLFVGTIRGRFTEFDAEIVFDRERPDRSRVSATVQAASVDTGNAARDIDIRSKQLLDVEHFPLIRFVSSEVVGANGDTISLRGALTIRGRTREIVLVGRVHELGSVPHSEFSVLASFAAELDRRDFSVEASPLIGTKIALTIDAVMIPI